MSIKLPNSNCVFPEWEEKLELNYCDSFWDSEDMDNLNKTLINTGLALKRINNELQENERIRLQKELEYKQKFRREMQSASGRTEAQKKIVAEINCEELETELVYYDQLTKELTKLSNSLRIDLDILKTIGFNLRQEMKI